MSNLPDAQKRFEAAEKLLQAHSTVAADKISAIGYCFGGGVVLQMARLGLDLDGVASFHGPLAAQNPAQKGKVKTKILVATGKDDPFIPAAQVASIKKEMAAAGADLRVFEYPGAKHSFTNPDANKNGEKFKLPLAYNQEADTKSWAELTKFLNELYPSG
jgi:dienelactone hydrolase